MADPPPASACRTSKTLASDLAAFLIGALPARRERRPAAGLAQLFPRRRHRDLRGRDPRRARRPRSAMSISTRRGTSGPRRPQRRAGSATRSGSTATSSTATCWSTPSGRLCAVIDFGCAAVGDPACDLTFAWTFLDGDSREAFRAGLALDDGTWARARGWALWKAAIMLAGFSDGNLREQDLPPRRDRGSAGGARRTQLVAKPRCPSTCQPLTEHPHSMVPPGGVPRGAPPSERMAETETSSPAASMVGTPRRTAQRTWDGASRVRATRGEHPSRAADRTAMGPAGSIVE